MLTRLTSAHWIGLAYPVLLLGLSGGVHSVTILLVPLGALLLLAGAIRTLVEFVAPDLRGPFHPAVSTVLIAAPLAFVLH